MPACRVTIYLTLPSPVVSPARVHPATLATPWRAEFPLLPEARFENPAIAGQALWLRGDDGSNRQYDLPPESVACRTRGKARIPVRALYQAGPDRACLVAQARSRSAVWE